jgi:ADP-heptose:LPS heptosyltransferase
LKRVSVEGFPNLHRAISACDVVVTVDTAIAHIAGAMGVPTLVMLPSNPDWRWGTSGEKTVWYDSVRLFRAAAPKQWGPVVEQVKAEIERMLAA